MKHASFIITALLFAAACGAPNSNIMREARAKNAELQAAAYQNASTVVVDGLRFTVARVAGSYSGSPASSQAQAGPRYNDREFALVDFAGPSGAPYTPTQVQAAAQRATGCQAQFDAGVLAFVGGFSSSVNLQELASRVSTSVRGWRANLNC